MTDYGYIDTVFLDVTSRSGTSIYLTYNSSSGFYETSSLFLSYGSFNYIIITNDTAGNQRTSISYGDSATNYIPEVSNIQVTPNTPNTTQDLTLSYDYYDLDGQVESGTEIRWYLEGVLLSNYNNSLTLPNNVFNKNNNITVSVRPKDGLDFGIIGWSNTINIINSAPVASAASISPASNVKTSASLSIIYTYYDIDGDTENTGNIEVRWYRNGTLVPGLNDLTTISSTNTQKGDIWTFQVRVSDGVLFSEWINSAPVINYALFTVSNMYTSNDLVTNISVTDDDGDTPIYTIR